MRSVLTAKVCITILRQTPYWHSPPLRLELLELLLEFDANQVVRLLCVEILHGVKALRWLQEYEWSFRPGAGQRRWLARRIVIDSLDVRVNEEQGIVGMIVVRRSVVPGGMVTEITRRFSFSKTILWFPAAAIAEAFLGSQMAGSVPSVLMGKGPCFAIGSLRPGGNDRNCGTPLLAFDADQMHRLGIVILDGMEGLRWLQHHQWKRLGHCHRDGVFDDISLAVSVYDSLGPAIEHQNRIVRVQVVGLLRTGRNRYGLNADVVIFKDYLVVARRRFWTVHVPIPFCRIASIGADGLGALSPH